MKNLGIYIRKSRDSKNQKSLKEQRLLGTEFCKENNFNPIFYDEGIVSGAGSTDKRPEYTRMISDIENGKLYGIYLWNSDRAAREEIAWYTLANLLKANNVFLFDNGTKADFNDDNTMLFYGMKSNMDAHFARVTSTKIKAVLKRNANEGKYTGILKYGYKRNKKGKTVINEDEAKIINEIFDLCIDGKGYSAIAEYLNEKGIPTSYNKLKGTYKKDKNLHGNEENINTKSKEDAKWVSAVVGKILRNRNYIGEKIYNDKLMEFPKIVSLSKFENAQERIDGRKNKHGKKSFKKYLLNDILICSNCGKRYTGRLVNKHLYYRCASRIVKGGSCGSAGIKLTFLDELVWDYFFNDKYLLQTIYINSQKAKDLPKASTIEKEINTLRNILKAKEKELTNVTKYLIQGVIKESEASTQLTRIRTEITDAELNIERKQETLDNLKTLDNKLEDYQSEIKNLRHNTPFDKKKEIIEKHLKEVNIINVDGYFTINLLFKSFRHTERFIVDKLYKKHWVAIEQDELMIARGYKNAIEWNEIAFKPENVGLKITVPQGGVKIYDMEGNLE